MAHFRNHQKVQGVLVKKLMTGQQNREKNTKQQQQPPDVFCKKRCFPANFGKHKPFSTEHVWATASKTGNGKELPIIIDVYLRDIAKPCKFESNS